MLALRKLLSATALLLVLGWLASSPLAQTRAADASPPGGFAVRAPVDYSLPIPAVPDPFVLPGCVATAEHDCNTQIAGRLYMPTAITVDDGAEYPIIVLLHGNHFTCGRAYNPATDRADLNSTPPPRIDDNNRFAGLGACPGGAPAYTVVPSFRGYDYVGNRLASYGYVVVSVDANRGIGGFDNVQGVNDFGLILARGRLVLRNLETLSEWNSTRGASNPFLGGIDLFGKLDFTQVGMFGHSRGGEGVMAAYNLYFNDPAGTDWETDIGPVGFDAIYELAPTDFRNFVGDPQDADDLAWNALLPGCDGDVETLDGEHPFDRMLNRGLSNARISTYLAWGTNHNFFNNQWQTTDGIDTRRNQQGVPAPTCYSPPNLRCVDPNANPDNRALFGNSIFSANTILFGQQNSLLSSVTAFFRSTVDAGANVRFDANFNPLVGVPGRVTNPAGNVRLYPTSCIEREYSRPPVDLTDFDDFRMEQPFNQHSTAATPVRNSTGGSTVLQYQHSFGVVDLNDPTQRIARLRWRRNPRENVPFFQDNWTPVGMGRDITGFATLDFRIARQINDIQNLNPGVSTDFSIYLVSGTVPQVFAGPVRLSTALGQGFASLTGPLGEALSDSKITYHPYMETVRIRLSAFPNLAAVQRNVRGVMFYFDQTSTGGIFVANITLSPDLGPGIPATGGSPIPKPEVQESLLAAGQAPSGPIVHAGTMTSMQSGVRVYSVQGIAHSGGVKLDFTSADPFPAGDAAVILKIGPQTILTGNVVDLSHAVFTLTPEEFTAAQNGDRVVLQKGLSQNPNQIWDFGSFNKSMAQPQK